MTNLAGYLTVSTDNHPIISDAGVPGSDLVVGFGNSAPCYWEKSCYDFLHIVSHVSLMLIAGFDKLYQVADLHVA